MNKPRQLIYIDNVYIVDIASEVYWRANQPHIQVYLRGYGACILSIISMSGSISGMVR